MRMLRSRVTGEHNNLLKNYAKSPIIKTVFMSLNITHPVSNAQLVTGEISSLFLSRHIYGTLGWVFSNTFNAKIPPPQPLTFKKCFHGLLPFYERDFFPGFNRQGIYVYTDLKLSKPRKMK